MGIEIYYSTRNTKSQRTRMLSYSNTLSLRQEYHDGSNFDSREKNVYYSNCLFLLFYRTLKLKACFLGHCFFSFGQFYSADVRPDIYYHFYLL